MFSTCKSLKYLNLYSFILNYTVDITNSFHGTSQNLIFCIKDNYTKNYLFGKDRYSICLEPCSNDNIKKINIFNDLCINSCIYYGFEYEYKNICYYECPNNTYTLYNNNKNKNNINNSKECFDQIPQGYYLDINEKKYKQCYKYCESCYGEGNETYNNCIQCIGNFSFYNNSENVINCYPICNNYYYFNESNAYHCTETLECPEKYNKLILEKKKCIDRCEKDEIYLYEYNKSCYKQRPENIFNDSIYVETSFIKIDIINT